MTKQRAKKKRRAPLTALLCVLLAAVLAAGGWMILSKAGERRRQQLAELGERASALTGLTAAGTEIPASETEYAGEIDGRELADSFGSDESASVSSESYSLPLALAGEPASCAITVAGADGAAVFTGGLEEYESFAPTGSGEYRFEVDASWEDGLGVSARCVYRFKAVYDIAARVYLTRTTVPQGNATMLVAENLRDPASLSVTVDYPYEPQVELTAHGGCACLPINYMRDPGRYSVGVSYDGASETLSFEVTETEYEVQHLTVSSSTVSSTIGNDDAYTEIAEKFYSLDSHFDQKIYWTEDFIQPLQGGITTEYGIKRYTNNAATPTRHAGIDIAAAEGAEILASNSGVVLFADHLQMTGYTIMIEHGMGVHTVYYHMSGLNCAAGDAVSRGDVIGYVGSTGFATGPHLHFAVMVNTVSVSPWYVFDGTSGIYDIRERLS